MCNGAGGHACRTRAATRSLRLPQERLVAELAESRLPLLDITPRNLTEIPNVRNQRRPRRKCPFTNLLRGARDRAVPALRIADPPAGVGNAAHPRNPGRRMAVGGPQCLSLLCRRAS